MTEPIAARGMLAITWSAACQVPSPLMSTRKIAKAMNWSQQTMDTAMPQPNAARPIGYISKKPIGTSAAKPNRLKNIEGRARESPSDSPRQAM